MVTEEPKVLLTWFNNYADEFDTEGFDIVPKSRLLDAIAKVKKYKLDLGGDYSIGSNESVYFSHDQIMEELESGDELTQEQSKFLEDKLMRRSADYGYGFAFFDNVLDMIYDYEWEHGLTEKI